MWVILIFFSASLHTRYESHTENLFGKSIGIRDEKEVVQIEILGKRSNEVKFSCTYVCTCVQIDEDNAVL